MTNRLLPDVSPEMAEIYGAVVEWRGIRCTSLPSGAPAPNWLVEMSGKADARLARKRWYPPDRDILNFDRQRQRYEAERAEYKALIQYILARCGSRKQAPEYPYPPFVATATSSGV